MESDKRFAHIATDPKFRRIPKSERKVKIDKRFQSMFTDKNFKVKYTVDKRGRPVNQTSTEDLKRYYELSSEESESDSEKSELEEKEKTNGENAGKLIKAPQNEIKAKIKNNKVIPDKAKKKLKNLNIDYARGEAALFSESSSDDEETDDDVSDIEDIEHKWGELDADADKVDEATKRLAACNMDWDRIKATDLMVLFNSFLPPGGLIHSVIIYPSEFGKKRIAEEEVKGPIELVESKNVDDDNNENEEGSKYHMEKLRQYQLNRLKYYYAVVTCDSANTANKIYTECDGMEYESSATKIDLRFIPDDMVFDDEPKEVCEKIPEVTKYKPRFFTTSALQQAKVGLTWDETDPDRIEITEKLASGKIDDITEADLQNYLASSSGEESEAEEKEGDDSECEEDNPIDKYKALLQEIESKEKEKEKKDVGMEISWGMDLQDKTEKLVKKKIAENENKTPFQEYLDKRKEKRKEKRQQKKKGSVSDSSSDSDVPSDVDMNDPYFAEEFNKPDFKNKKKNAKPEPESDSEDKQKQAELELLLANDGDDKKHFSLKMIQDQENESKSKKKKNRKNKKEEVQKVEDDFCVNVNDDRFSALFTSHHYNIDPTDPHYKKTKGMETFIEEKIKRRVDEDQEQAEPTKKKKKDNKSAELSVLVKSVKRKAEAFGNKNK